MNGKVLITGINMISSLGLNIDENWKNLIAGKSGISRIDFFNTDATDTKIAGQVTATLEEYTGKYIKKRIAKQMTRVTRMCFTCAKECIESHNIDFESMDPERCGVIIGSVSTGNSSVEAGTTDQNRILKCMSNAMPAWISLHYKLEGPNFSVNTACASSAYAIGLAYDLIKTGQADIVIAGGADSTINPEEIAGFNELYTLSTDNENPQKASRPFTKDRDGFVIGEGAGILVLESEKSARDRGAEVYGELAGYAFTSEAYNIMSPKKDGVGMKKTMEMALKRSGVQKDQVNYINAHGTSTMLNDLYETMAIKDVFNSRASAIPVSSTKSMTGHTIAAAGAIEAAITVMAIKEGIIPPTINYDNPDPELDLDYVPNRARKQVIDAAISNSFAFGGHNATLVFKQYN